MKKKVTDKIKLTSLEELLGCPGEESATEIDINKIHGFKNHPFKVVDDEKMADLVESIRKNGVLTPVILRPYEKYDYEMISGHRRLHAAKLAGLTTIPGFVRDMTDDEAVVNMVDSNIQREKLLPSEKAFAYKMKLDAMKRQAGRPTKENACHNGTHLRSDQEMAVQIGESARNIQRYIRLTELIPDILDLVDLKRLNFTIAVDISYINKEIQPWIYEYIRENGFIKPNQIAALRRYLDQGSVPITQHLMISILNSASPIKPIAKKVTLQERKLMKYFPREYTVKDMEAVIVALLEKWKKDQGDKEEEE